MRHVMLAALAVLGTAAPAYAGTIDLAIDTSNLALQFHQVGYSSPSYVLPNDNEAFPLQLPCEFLTMNGHIVMEHNAGQDRIYPKGRFSLRDEFGNTITSQGNNPGAGSPIWACWRAG